MKGFVLCLVSVLLMVFVEGCCQKITGNKLNMSVLYVGFDPGRELPPMNFAHGAGIACLLYTSPSPRDCS